MAFPENLKIKSVVVTHRIKERDAEDLIHLQEKLNRCSPNKPVSRSRIISVLITLGHRTDEKILIEILRDKSF